MIGGGGGAKRVIYDALLGNLGIAISKLCSCIFNRYTSMWADNYHSFTDTFSQVPFLTGIRTYKNQGSDNILLDMEKNSFLVFCCDHIHLGYI